MQKISFDVERQYFDGPDGRTERWEFCNGYSSLEHAQRQRDRLLDKPWNKGRKFRICKVTSTPEGRVIDGLLTSYREIAREVVES